VTAQNVAQVFNFRLPNARLAKLRHSNLGAHRAALQRMPIYRNCGAGNGRPSSFDRISPHLRGSRRSGTYPLPSCLERIRPWFRTVKIAASHQRRARIRCCEQNHHQNQRKPFHGDDAIKSARTCQRGQMWRHTNILRIPLQDSFVICASSLVVARCRSCGEIFSPSGAMD
jgi:hypothetical protein